MHKFTGRKRTPPKFGGVLLILMGRYYSRQFMKALAMPAEAAILYSFYDGVHTLDDGKLLYNPSNSG